MSIFAINNGKVIKKIYIGREFTLLHVYFENL